jgi:transposase InsO family protein
MPNDPTSVEIITGRERRRRYSAEQKLRLVEDYNEVHPHQGLQMRSPREFIRDQSQPAPRPV